MERLITPDEMRGLDRQAMTRLKIPGIVLMENAGRGVVDRLEAATGSVSGKHVVVVCGKGNNGGDGFVAARHLLLRGATVDVVLLASPAAVTGDAASHLASLRAMQKAGGGSIRLLSQASRFVAPRGTSPAIIIDALFGTGFSGAPRGVAASAIRWINGQRAFVAAVDIPSGLDGATGAAGGEVVRADLTVTMAAAKPGVYLQRGPEVSGKVDVVDIGITPAFLQAGGLPLLRAADADIAQILPQRPRHAHKYSVGKVFVIGGSRQYTGAPAFAAMAAFRSGAGAVVLGVPESVKPLLAGRHRELVVEGLPETPGGMLAQAAMDPIRARCDWADVVVIGPGLGRGEETDALVRAVFAACRKPVVLDADGLTAFTGARPRDWRRPGPTILTPHTGEMARLTGQEPAAIESGRIEAARAAAHRLGAVVVLKGAPTVCAAPGGACVVNATGNPGLATMGTGDVLAGAVGGLCAQGMPVLDAAVAAVFLHGRAGDLAAERYGQRSLLAADVLDFLPAAIRSVEHP